MLLASKEAWARLPGNNACDAGGRAVGGNGLKVMMAKYRSVLFNTARNCPFSSSGV